MMEVKMDWVGVKDNAFAMLGAFRKAARRQGYAQTDIDRVIDDARSRDYEHLANVLMRNTVPE